MSAPTELLETMRRRFSCRRFRADPVPSDALMTLVEAARLAPSGKGTQPWEFVVVTDPTLRANLGRLAPNCAHIAGAAACLAVFCRRDAPHALEDGAAATQNILLAATGLNLGACWIAGAGRPYAARVAELLRSPEGLQLISLVAIGVAAENPPADRARRSLEDVLHWQGF